MSMTAAGRLALRAILAGLCALLIGTTALAQTSPSPSPSPGPSPSASDSQSGSEAEQAESIPAQRAAIQAYREELYQGVPPSPTAILDLSARRTSMRTTDLHAAVHAASLESLQTLDIGLLSANPRLELLAIPRSWTTVQEVMRVSEELGESVELVAIHVAFAGLERTSVGIIERLPGRTWPQTLDDWDEFFAASVEGNITETRNHLEALADDPVLKASEERYLSDANKMLQLGTSGQYPVYAMRYSPTGDLGPELVNAIRALLLEGDIGGLLIPKGAIPAALVPPEDPVRDRAVEQTTLEDVGDDE